MQNIFARQGEYSFQKGNTPHLLHYLLNKVRSCSQSPSSEKLFVKQFIQIGNLTEINESD